MSGLVTEEQLKEWSGHTTRPAIKNWLDNRNIFYFEGKGGRICVTLSAIEEKQQNGVITFGQTA